MSEAQKEISNLRIGALSQLARIGLRMAAVDPRFLDFEAVLTSLEVVKQLKSLRSVQCGTWKLEGMHPSATLDSRVYFVDL